MKNSYLLTYRIAFILVVMIITLSACTQRRKLLDVEYIDYSCYNGWDRISSVRIEKSGEVFLYIESLKKSSNPIRLTLSEQSIDSLNYLVKKLEGGIFFESYTANCVDCGYYRLQVQGKDKLTDVFVEDINNEDSAIVDLNNLSIYLFNIIASHQNDTPIFRSKTREFRLYIPPPPKSVVDTMLP